MFRACPSEQNDGEIDGRVIIQMHCKGLLPRRRQVWDPGKGSGLKWDQVENMGADPVLLASGERVCLIASLFCSVLFSVSLWMYYRGTS